MIRRRRSTLGKLGEMLLDEVDSVAGDIRRTKRLARRNPIEAGAIAIAIPLIFAGIAYFLANPRELPEEFYKKPTTEEMREKGEAQMHLIYDTKEEIVAGLRIAYELNKASREKYGTMLPPTKAEYDALTEEIRIGGKSMAKYQEEQGMKVGNDSLGKLVY